MAIDGDTASGTPAIKHFVPTQGTVTYGKIMMMYISSIGNLGANIVSKF